MVQNKRQQQLAKQKKAVKRTIASKKRATKAVHRAPQSQSQLPSHAPKPDSFATYADVVAYAKHYVYQITRLRRDGDQTTQASLGTGFLIGPNRLMTCAHCIDDTNNPDLDMAHHKTGDAYMFIRRDEEGAGHTSVMVPELEQTLFYDHATDFAVFYLTDDFYKMNGQYVLNPANHLRLCEAPRNIGSGVGILGYPLQGLAIGENGTPDISKIYIRGDMGVVNTRHFTDNRYYYEFTMPFNPGNSGGPILDTVTGDVIGMVHAFNSIPLRAVEDVINNNNEDGTVSATKITSILRTTYSLGLASENFKPYKDQHSLSYGS